MNKKKKSTNTSPYPDEVIDRLARAFYPAILACWNSEEGQREFAAWQAEQAHHTPSKEKQSVPDGERPVVHIAIVCGFFRVRPQGAPCFCMLKLLVLVFSKSHSHFIPKFILRNCSSIFQSCLSPHIAFQSFLVYVLPNHLF